MFDSGDIFNRVIEPEELDDRFTIIQCCTDDIYRPILQRVCECVSLATYQQKMLNVISTIK